MPARRQFEQLNHLFDVKHIAFDLRKGGLLDEQVYQEAAKLYRLIITFNGKDFKSFACPGYLGHRFGKETLRGR